jgi:hypothetical protein
MLAMSSDDIFSWSYHHHMLLLPTTLGHVCFPRCRYLPLLPSCLDIILEPFNCITSNTFSFSFSPFFIHNYGPHDSYLAHLVPPHSHMIRHPTPHQKSITHFFHFIFHRIVLLHPTPPKGFSIPCANRLICIRFFWTLFFSLLVSYGYPSPRFFYSFS